MPHLYEGFYPRANTVSNPNSNANDDDTGDDGDGCSPFDIVCILGGGDDSTTSNPLGFLTSTSTTKTSSATSKSSTSSTTTSTTTTTTSKLSATSAPVSTTSAPSVTTPPPTSTPPVILNPTTSANSTNNLAANNSGPTSFLQDKAAEGAVFGIVGVLGLILLVVAVTWRLRKARRDQLNNEAMSYDPSNLPPMAERQSIDTRSLYGNGSNSGHGHYGGAPVVNYQDIHTAAPMVAMNGAHPQYYNPGPPAMYYGNNHQSYGSMDPYGGMDASYGSQYPVYPQAGGYNQSQAYPQHQQQAYMVQPARLEQSLPPIPAPSRVAVPPLDLPTEPPRISAENPASALAPASATLTSATFPSEDVASKMPAASPLPDTFGEDLKHTVKEEPVLAAPPAAAAELAVAEPDPKRESVVEFVSAQPLKVANE